MSDEIIKETSEVVNETEAQGEPKVIKVDNPTQEEMKALTETIKVNYNADVVVKPVTFRFKKTKDQATGIETVREPVDLAIPYPSVQGIVTILEAGGKQLELLIDAMETVVNAQARDLLYEDTKLTAATFPVEKLSWEFIANLPKAQRRGGGIPKETWEDFCKDYIEVMPGITGKTEEQVTKAAQLFANKLNSVKTAKPIISLLLEQLGIYAENAANAEDYAECIAFLVNKAETYLNVSDEDLLANL